MQTHLIHVIGGHERVRDVRCELFAFSDVLDVVVSGQPDLLVVVCSGRPCPAEWLAALRAAGFQIPVRHRVRALTRTASRDDRRMAA